MSERSRNIFLRYLLVLITTGYKTIITKFNAFVKVVGERRKGWFMFWTFEGGGRGGGGVATKTEQMQTRMGGGGTQSKFWAFCDKALIECPHQFYFILLRSSELEVIWLNLKWTIESRLINKACLNRYNIKSPKFYTQIISSL